MGRNNMRKQSIFIFVFILFFSTDCSQKLIPGITVAKQPGKEFDEASYNYVYAEAIRQKLLGKDAQALELLQKSIELNPESDAAYYQIAQIVSNDGDNLNARKYLKKAIQIQPGNFWYNVMLAGLYYQVQNTDSTIICYENALKYYPEKENLMINLANLYTEKGELAKAREILEKLEMKYGTSENTTVPLVRNLIVTGAFDEALAKVENLLSSDPENLAYNELLSTVYRKMGKNEDALDVYYDLIRNNPDDPKITLSLCFFLNEEGNYEELFALTDRVIISNDISREDKINLFATLLGNDELVEKFGPKLETNLMLLEANYKDDGIIVLMRPELIQKSRRLDDAAGLLEEIVKENPDNYFAWVKLRMLYYEKKDYDKLYTAGEICATKFNRSFLAKILFATGAIEKGNYEIALEELRKADILAGDEKALKLQVLTIKADVYYRMKNYDLSFTTFNEALKVDSEDLTVLNNYAYFLAEQDKRLKEAEIMAKKVIEKDKNNTTFLDTYAWVLYKRGKVREALRVMERIINSGENEDAEWYEHYGYILSKMRRCEEAIASWRKALDLDDRKTKLLKEIENCGK